MKSKLRTVVIVVVAAIFVVGCSNSVKQFSPEQVVNNALEKANSITSFYAESEIIIENKGDIIEQMSVKEWRDGSKVRVEIESESEKAITVLDENQFVVYDETNNTAIISEDDLTDFTQMSMKEQAEMLLELISESHEIEMAGEEKIADRDAFYIKAEQKNESALFGDQELWIDKENWLVLKMISVSGDLVTKAEYKKVDFNAEITEDLFTIDLPEDVDIQDSIEFELEEMSDLTESIEKLGESFLYVPETDDLSIDLIDFSEIGDGTHKEVNMTYKKDDQSLFELVVINSSIGDDEDLDMFNFGEDEVDVRGQDGSYFEMDELRILSWEEGGLNYSVQLVDIDLSLEEMIKILDSMVMVE